MALGKKVLEIILELYDRNFFKNINSVMDMGDQDVNATYEEIKNKFKTSDVKFDENLWRNAKKFPERPRVSTSTLWKSLGIKDASRMDIVKLDRDDNDSGTHIIQDLNYPLSDKELIQKFDLVTDIGNNEHPFNIAESYNTMHKLCKKNGYMIIYQAYLNGNGFYQFDHCTIDNVAAVNNYSVIHSCFIVNQDGKTITLPLDKNYLKLINLNNVDEIEIFYLLKKNGSDDFKFPYQGTGKNPVTKEYYSLNISHKNTLPETMYIPHSIENINTRILIRQLFHRLIKIFKK